MTKAEFAEQLAQQLNDDNGDENLGTVWAEGSHVHVKFGPAAVPDAGEEFTLLVIKEAP